MEVVKVLQKGQIVIPKDMREDLNIKEGNRLIIERINGSFLVMPEPKDALKVMHGLFKPLATESAVQAVRRLRRESERRIK